MILTFNLDVYSLGWQWFYEHFPSIAYKLQIWLVGQKQVLVARPMSWHIHLFVGTSNKKTIVYLLVCSLRRWCSFSNLGFEAMKSLELVAGLWTMKSMAVTQGALSQFSTTYICQWTGSNHVKPPKFGRKSSNPWVGKSGHHRRLRVALTALTGGNKRNAE